MPDIFMLQSSLATLNTSTLFVEEKYKLIESIKEQYNKLDTKNKKTINKWLNGRYKIFLEKLIKYDKNIHNTIDFVNYSFRWGISGVTSQDVDFSYYLVNPIITKEKFKDENISSYAFLTHGNILFHYFRESINEYNINRETLFQRALNSLIQSYNSAKNDYLKNRSSYFLTQLYSLNSDFNSSIVWYYRSLDCSDLVHDQFSMLFALLFKDIDKNMILSFNFVGKFFIKENIQNKYFWLFVKSKISNSLAINHIDTIINLSSPIYNKKVDSWGKDIEDFFTTLNSYISLVVEPLDEKSSSQLQTLYFNSILNNHGKSEVLFRMAQIQRFYINDLGRAMLMASEANTLFFNLKRLDFMSRIILEEFGVEIREILDSSSCKFQNKNIDFYCFEKDRKVSAWKRLLKKGCLSGRVDEEIEFLEYINSYTDNKKLSQILKTRLAYLYFKGTAGISEDGYEKANYQKAKIYFESIKENTLVLKHLQHPKLSIYLDMEKASPIGDENYLFFEKRISNKILIVFSCAFSYMHYTQLREFYQKNKINVIFISNPTLNWYHGLEWDRVESIMKQIVFKKFKKENVTTYFGSMGGYGALRVALTYGLKSIVFNPQIDLNIWIKHRPVISTRLKPYDLVHIQSFSRMAFENTPIYIMSSSSIEDVEVFKILIDKFTECKKGLFIIEKIPDNLHAGIFAKVYSGNQQNSILNISALQDKYYPSNKYEKINYQIPKGLTEKFWRFINNSMKLRVIIQINNGDIFCAGVKDNFGVKPTLYSIEDEIKQ